MNTTKKIFAISIIMAMGFLASCGHNYENITNNQTTQNQEIITISDKNITLNNESIIITEAGEYTISGNIDNGQIIVDVGEKNNVKIILDNVNVNNNSSSALYIKSGKATIELAQNSENILSDGENYSDTSDDAPNSTIYAVEDFIIIGSGKLTINGNYNDGINTKDDLTIENGEIVINSKDDGIRGKDSVTINNGNITITSGGDAIKSDHETKGNIVINNGNININAGSDGMEAYITMTINDGNINIINSEEGLESEKIIINNGNINIKSTDDGINVSSSSTNSSENPPAMNLGNTTVNEDIKLTINGGNIIVDADGDGLDANGSIEINGGKTIIYGPTNNGNASLDYDATMIINGGELIAFGTSGMAQNITSTSTQNAILINLTNNHNSNNKIIISNSEGNIIFEGNSKKNFNSILFSSSDLLKNQNYNYFIGSENGNFTINSVASSVGQGGMNNFGGRGRIMPTPNMQQ